MNGITTVLIIGLFALAGGCATAGVPLSSPPGTPSGAVRHNEEGIQHYKMGHWGLAKTHFEAAVQSNPPFAEAHYNLGLALDQLGDHPGASSHFKHAGELAPNNPAITQSDVYQYHVGAGPRPGVDPVHRPILGGY